MKYKNNKIEPPEMYLGAKLKECDDADGINVTTGIGWFTRIGPRRPKSSMFMSSDPDIRPTWVHLNG